MSYDDWDDAESEYLAKVVEEGIAEQRADSVRWYLGTYGDAVQERVTRSIGNADKLAAAGFPSQAVVSAVTAVELMIRYYILRPLVEGALLSEEWTAVLVGRIFTRRAEADRQLLPAIARSIGLDVERVSLQDGRPLWRTFVTEILPLRNRIVHLGDAADTQTALAAATIPKLLLRELVTPLAEKYGMSWPATRVWHQVTQGVGAATFSTTYKTKDPFTGPEA